MPRLVVTDPRITPELQERFSELYERRAAYEESTLASRSQRWRCERLDCDGRPHEGYEYAHARSKQVLRGWLPTGEDTGPYRVAYVRGGRRSGKMLALDTPVPTPSGWAKMGELEVGDQVFDEAGRVCCIVATYDGWPEVAYRLTFSDHSTIDACSEHQWVTWTHRERKAWLRHGTGHGGRRSVPKDRFPGGWPTWRNWAGTGPQVRTTQDIAETFAHGARGDTNHCVPLAGALEMPERPLLADPWVLGFWLGDGTTREAVVTVGDQDMAEVVGLIESAGYSVRPWRRQPNRAQMFGVGRLHEELSALGVLGDKHVPASYLRASAQQRLALLQGLLDSDGHCAGRGTVEFISTLRVLADAVVELARSLGQKPVLAEGRATLKGQDFGPKYRVTWRPTIPCFRLARKLAGQSRGKARALQSQHRMIVGIERIEPVPMRCFTVDSPNSMYLAGEAMIPTHNTWSAANHLAELITNFPGKEWACVGPTFADARDICMENVHSGLIKALGGKIGGEGRLVEKGPYIAAWNRSMGQLRLKNDGVVYCDGADDGAYRIQGHGLAGCWGDEVGLWVKWRAAFDESIRYAVSNFPAKLIVTGTPKRTLGARVLVKRLIDDPDVLNVQLHTEENLHNLDPAAAADFMSHAGTALERQELHGDLLEEVEGALWKIKTWEDTRIEIPDYDQNIDPYGVEAIYDLIQPTRVAISVDPAVSGSEDADEHGIIVTAKGQDGDIYVLEDLSFRGAVTAWPGRVIEAHSRWQADRVIAEVNNGGDYVEQTLRAGGYRGGYEVVRATRGKMIRAEPVATYHEKLHVHAVGHFPELEGECCTWVPGEDEDSPNRLDALVYGAAWMRPELVQGWGSVYKPFTDEEKAEQRKSRAGWASLYTKAEKTEEPVPGPAPAPRRGGYFDT